MKESQEKHKDGEKTIAQGIVSIVFSIDAQPERRKLEKKRERIGKMKWDGYRKASQSAFGFCTSLRMGTGNPLPPLIIIPIAPFLYGLSSRLDQTSSRLSPNSSHTPFSSSAGSALTNEKGLQRDWPNQMNTYDLQRTKSPSYHAPKSRSRTWRRDIVWLSRNQKDAVTSLTGTCYQLSWMGEIFLRRTLNRFDHPSHIQAWRFSIWGEWRAEINYGFDPLSGYVHTVEGIELRIMWGWGKDSQACKASC